MNCQPPALAPGNRNFDADSFGRIIDGLSPDELRNVAVFVAGYSPEAFEAALRSVSLRRVWLAERARKERTAA